jgi:hypothetical protein
MLRLDDLMELICLEFLEINNVLILTTTEEITSHKNNRRLNYNRSEIDSLGISQ